MTPLVIILVLLAVFTVGLGMIWYGLHQYYTQQRKEQIEWAARRDAEWAESKKKWRLY